MCNFSGRWGYIDKTGKLVITYQWDNARNFIKGKSAVQEYKEDRKGKWALIDKTGKLLTPYQYSKVGIFNLGQWE